MQIFIKCGGDGCGREFKADTEQGLWLCPHCDHEIKNKNYPFLSARLMEAKRLPEEADWKDLLDLVLRNARVKMIENNMLRVETGLEKISMGLLAEYENRFDSGEEMDFQKETLEAIEKLGSLIREQENELTQ